MSRTFQDEDDQMWEEVEAVGLQDVRNIVIRPVKQEPKWHTDLEQQTGGTNPSWNLSINLASSQDQAQLIKECVEVMMGRILSDSPLTHDYLGNRIEEARQSMRENN